MQSDLRKIQLIELDILKEIDRVCQKHDIKYFLDCGTALGAVRHKGFIPWDDDIDIGMTRENYNKFIKIAPLELTENYFLQSLETEKKCPHLFAKVMKKNTLYMSWAWKNIDIPQGIWVDIFPYDYCTDEDDKSIKDFRLLSKIYGYKMIPNRFLKDDGTIKWKLVSVVRKLLYYLLFLYPQKKLINQIDKVLNSFNKNNKKYSIPLVFPEILKLEKKIVEDLQVVEFEDSFFPITKYIHEYLTLRYGDYMKLPPEEKRVGHLVYKYNLKSDKIENE